jgi:hypothetical protein
MRPHNRIGPHPEMLKVGQGRDTNEGTTLRSAVAATRATLHEKSWGSGVFGGLDHVTSRHTQCHQFSCAPLIMRVTLSLQHLIALTTDTQSSAFEYTLA